MLKAATDRHLVLGLTAKELELLKEGKPLMVRLDDVGYDALVTIITGENNEQLKRMMDEVNQRIANAKIASEMKIDLSQIRNNKGH